MRREHDLCEDDVAALAERGLDWETVSVTGGGAWLLVHKYPVFPGYNHTHVTAALRLDSTYPDTQIDMVYVDPPLARNDGKHIAQLTMADVAGKQFQQWSRHRTPANPWRPGVDGLRTQLMLVDEWFEREFKLR